MARKRDEQDKWIADLLKRTDAIAADLGGTGIPPSPPPSGGKPADGAVDTGASLLGAALLAELHDPNPAPELVEAAKRIGFNLEHHLPTREGLEGMTVLLRGAIGEMHTLHGIENGTIPMPPGAKSAILGDFRTPALDLRFVDGQGDALRDTANVKIGTDYGVVAHHFQQHPEVRFVYASHELAQASAAHGIPVIDGPGPFPTRGPVVIDTHLNATHMTDHVQSGLAVHHEITWIEVLNWFPVVSLGVISGRALQDSRKGLPAHQVRNRAADRSLVVAATWVTGRLLVLTGALGPLAPVTLMAEAFIVSTLVGGVRQRAERTEQLRELIRLLETWSGAPSAEQTD